MLRPFLYGFRVLNEHDDGGSGGGGSGSGSDSGKSSGKGGAETPVTLAQVNEAISLALSARDKRLENKLNGTINTAVTAAITPLTETLSGLQTSLQGLAESKGGSGGDGGAGKGGSEHQDVTKHAEFVALKRSHDAVQTQLQKINEEREKERAALRSANRREALQKALTEAGVDPKRVAHARGYLENEGRIAFESEESDGLVFVTPDGPVPLKQGLQEFIGTDEGKYYLPARGTNGSGDGARGGGGNGSSGSKAKQGQEGFDKNALGTALLNLAVGTKQQPPG